MLNYRERVRLLSTEFEIRTNSAEVIQLLGSLTARADHNRPAGRCEIVEITATGPELWISGCGEEDDFELSVTALLDVLYRRLYRSAVAEFPDHLRIAAASGYCADGTFLVAGPARSGKSTLAVRLMLDGIAMAGDELVLLHDGVTVAVPRKFELRESSVMSIAGLASAEKYRRIAANPAAERVVAIDPREFGLPWRIDPREVVTIICLEPNFGARSRLTACTKVETLRRLMPVCTPPASGRREWIADLCGTVDRVGTFVLELGDLDSAADAIGALLARQA